MMPTVTFSAAPDRVSWLARLHPASKLAGLLLGLVSCYLLPAWSLPLVLLAISLALARRGLNRPWLAQAVKPWLPVVLLVLAVHTLTTVEAAPLGTPSWAGLVRGLVTLGRLVASAGLLVLFLRTTPLAALVAGLAWWLRPARRWGLDAEGLSLTLAVALGTVPGVVAEGRRIEAVVRLRRGGAEGAGRGPRRWWRRLLDRGSLVVPLLESMFRRVEGLTLALRGRLPHQGHDLCRPPFGHLLGLLIWTGLLVLLVWR